MTAQYRIEQYLGAIRASCLEQTPLPAYPDKPVWRIERFLAAILSAVNGDTPVEPCPDPVWRVEEYARAIYDALTGSSPAWPCPAVATNRTEEYLRAAYERVANGNETDIPAPAWDIEEFMFGAIDAIQTEHTYGPAALVSFDTVRTKPIKSLSVSIMPIQSGTGDPSPENICPITGWTRANVYVSPKNTLWSKYKLYVDTGAASEIFPVGKQITDTWKNTNGTEISFPWDVVHYTSGGDAFLKLHYAAPEALKFDAPEAAYYFDGTEPAGTYHIPIGSAYGTGWVVGHSIQFTLTAAPDEGDQLFIDCGTNYAKDPAGGRAWMVYDAGGTTVKQRGTTSEGTGGTSLGTIGNVNAHRTNGRLNAISRVVYGYARWSQSAMRQYFNSADVNWWAMKNPWDRPPAQASTIRGFLCGFSQDFLDHLEETEVVTALNTQEGFAEATETTLDKIFLPSLEQMYINPQLAGVEEESWDYYKALAEEAGLPGKFQQYQTYPILISYNASNTSSAAAVFSRSCYRGYANNEWAVDASGVVYGSYAANAFRGCPACKFKKSTPNGTRYAVDWATQAGTVYGGTLDVVTGVLTVDWNLTTLTGASNETWNDYTGGIGGYYISNVSKHIVESYGDGWCNMFPTAKSVYNTAGIIYGINSRYLFVMGAKEYASSVAEWKTWLASNPLQIVYKLATPLTYQLTPQEVTALVGTNNVWSNSGDVKVVV